MLYALYIIGFYLTRIMPRKMCYAIAELVARGYYLFASRDKEELRANLEVILGEDVDENTIERCILNVFRNFAKHLADFFKFQKITGDFISENIEISGLEYIEECLSEGKGVILVALHLGNWEMGGAVMPALKYPFNAIVLEHANPRINDFFKKRRSIHGVRGIPVRQRSVDDPGSIPVSVQIKECFRVLRNKELLVIVGDKDYTSTGIHVDFFGKKALMPKGPAAFSLKTGAPIIMSAFVRKKDDRFMLCFEPPIRYSGTGDYENDLRELMKKYLGLFEKYIRKYPDQWYAFKKIWDQQKITQ
ncbi:MAG: lysophospholipid acyltransferase family protein [Candidatus Omnitrophota bacterium]|nr:lysophospholipid acyltransferase family protein [Candidatus Omnitrophota bacterium]